MNLFTIPLKNLRRKALRTTMLTLVFSAGIIAVVALYYVSASIGENLEQKLSAYGANILIRPHSESLDVSYGGFSMGNLSYNTQKLNRSDVEKGIRGIEYNDRISAIAPKLLESSVIAGRETAVVGVEWEQELHLKNYWFTDSYNYGGHVNSGDAPAQPADNIYGLNYDDEFGANDLIAGNTAAKLLGLTKGGQIEIDGASFHVAAVLPQLGTDEDRLIFVDINTLQSIKQKPGEITFIEVSALCSGCPIEDIVAQIKSALTDTEVVAMQSVVKQRMFTIDFVKNLVLVISGVILVIACFMLAVFMMASVTERRSEIGILRSMGYSRGKIFCLFSFEAFVIGIVSGVIGFTAGYFTATKILAKMDLAGGTPAHFSITHLLICVAVVCAVSVAASIIPAVKAARTEPAGAIIRI